jgi:hypothetical protein
MDIIISNFSLIVTGLCAITLIILCIRNFIELPTSTQTTKVKEWLLYAVTLAEKEFGSGTGEIKLRYVYNLFVEKFYWLAKVVKFETFQSWAETALAQMKELLETNEAVDELVNKKEEN